MDRRTTRQRAYRRQLIVSDYYIPLLAFCGLWLIAVAPSRADIELPAITVTGKPTPEGDAVYRDRSLRSPDMHWPKSWWILEYAEMFAHNQIEINASCATVWNHLIRAELWPQWCPYSGKVKIFGGSRVLQAHSRFTWNGNDLPGGTDCPLFSGYPDPLEGEVYECIPESRLGWSSYGPLTDHGFLSVAYHNWLLKPIGPKRCVVTFEEVATGRAARYARGAYPEVLHLSHDRWLQELKRISEARDRITR
jgi:Polyketide cyclase / dehydrase and lipid transport